MSDTQAASAFYQDQIAPYLPPVVLDFHAHVWRRSDWHGVPWKNDARGSAYMVTEEDYPVERLLDDARRIFPGRDYRGVCFGCPTPSADSVKDAASIASAGAWRGLYPLIIAGAGLAVPAAILRARIEEHGFLGLKVFLPWHGDDYGETRVQDMLSANEMGLVVLLHVPRAGLSEKEIRAIFFDNGMTVLRSVMDGRMIRRAEARWQDTAAPRRFEDGPGA